MIAILLVAVALLAIYYYGTRNYSYWSKRGVVHEKPIPFMGNNARIFLMQRSVCQMCDDLYWKYPNEKIVGLYRGADPELVIRDPTIAKEILTTDFNYFYPRGDKLGAMIFKLGIKEFAINVLKIMFPWTFRNFKILGRFEGDLKKILYEVQRQRNFKLSGRHDFIDLLMECREKGKMVGESIERTTPDGKPIVATLEMDDDLMAGQVFIFFAAGFETSSSASSTTLNELAHNPVVQTKVQEEIDRVLNQHGNKLSYDAFKEMHYLEWTFKEGM